jgi:hypothetical protein
LRLSRPASGSKEIVNENNPEYLAAKQAFEMQQGVYMFAALVELGVDIDFTEEQQAAIDKRRKKKGKAISRACRRTSSTPTSMCR